MQMVLKTLSVGELRSPTLNSKTTSQTPAKESAGALLRAWNCCAHHCE